MRKLYYGKPKQSSDTEFWEQDGTRMSRLILACETARFAQKTDANGTLVATASGRNGNCAVDCDIPF